MRSCSQGQRRSVDRGTCGPGIQPRKKLPPGRRRCRRKRKAPSGAPISRGVPESRAVRDPVETLRMAYFRLKKEAAPGVDGETWRHYGEELERNLQELSERLKRGAYRAKPVRRVFIPKADGRQRPLGVTALEDKIVQRAAV